MLVEEVDAIRLQPRERGIGHLADPFRPAVHALARVSLLEAELGGDHRYDPGHYLIVTMQLPAIGRVVDASPQRPYLSLRLDLDPAVVTSVLVDS